jgi:hypothetical protein
VESNKEIENEKKRLHTPFFQKQNMAANQTSSTFSHGSIQYAPSIDERWTPDGEYIIINLSKTEGVSGKRNRTDNQLLCTSFSFC